MTNLNKKTFDKRQQFIDAVAKHKWDDATLKSADGLLAMYDELTNKLHMKQEYDSVHIPADQRTALTKAKLVTYGEAVDFLDEINTDDPRKESLIEYFEKLVEAENGGPNRLLWIMEAETALLFMEFIKGKNL